jgi:hypothetical protein
MAATVATPSTSPQNAALLRLQPRDVPGLFDQAVWLYRRNFRAFLGISALVQLPAAVLLALVSAWLLNDYSTIFTRTLDRSTIESGDSQQAFITSITDLLTQASLVSFVSLLSTVLIAVASGALARAIADRYLGRPVTVGGTYRAIRSQIIWLIVFVFVQIVVSYLFILPPLGIYVYVALSFVSQVIVLEIANVVTAMQRSWQLVQGQWWRVAGMGLLVLLVRTIMILPSSVTGDALLFIGAPNALALFATQFATLALELIYLPAQLAAVTLLYYDLRIRKEGYDLEMAIAERRAALGPAAVPFGSLPSPTAPAMRMAGNGTVPLPSPGPPSLVASGYPAPGPGPGVPPPVSGNGYPSITLTGNGTSSPSSAPGPGPQPAPDPVRYAPPPLGRHSQEEP